MNNELPPRNRMNPAWSGMNLWLIGLSILLGGITLVEAGIIYSMQRSASGNRQCLLSKILPHRWMPAAKSRGGQFSKDDRIVLLDSAQDIAAIHDQINRVLSTMACPAISTRSSLPTHFNAHPLVSPSLDRMIQLQNEIDRIFESSFSDMDVFSLPSRLEQGWNMNGVSSSMQIEDQATNVVVQMALPGVEASAIAVILQGRLLTVAVNQGADRQTSGSGKASGVAQRRQTKTKLMLPGPLDAAAAKATYRDGILSINIPKNIDEDPLARTINVI